MACWAAIQPRLGLVARTTRSVADIQLEEEEDDDEFELGDEDEEEYDDEEYDEEEEDGDDDPHAEGRAMLGQLLNVSVTTGLLPDCSERVGT